MPGPIRIKNLAQFYATIESGTGLTVTDTANAQVYHPHPDACPHVREGSFAEKVIANAERNGSYFAVPSLAEAQRHWPGIELCSSGVCSDQDQDLEALLRRATGFTAVRERKDEPVGAEGKPAAWTSTQRVALGLEGDRLALCTWPGELKAQAQALYASDRGERLLELLGSGDGWSAVPLPHLAFNGSRRADRFYFSCSLSIEEYIAGWSRGEDLEMVGGHAREAVPSELWPWLCERGYADGSDAGDLDRFMEALRRRNAQAHLRPGIEMTWHLDHGGPDDAEALSTEIRTAVSTLALALREPFAPA